MKVPKPSSTRLGGTASCTVPAFSFSVLATFVVPARSTIRLSISTKEPDSGRFDQRVSPVTWKSTIRPLPRRAAVTSGVPSASVAQVLSLSVASGSASTWRVTVTSLGTGMPLNGLSRENAASGCGLSQLRLPPRMRPPRRNLTGTRSSSDAGRRGPAKRTNTPAVLDPLGEAVMGVAGNGADIGEDHHGQFLVEELRDCVGWRLALGQPQVGERVQRPLDVIARRQQRLVRVDGRGGDNADGAAAPAFVEQLHGTRGTIADDFDARNVVADFDRQVEACLGLSLGCLESKRRVAERQTLEIKSAHRASLLEA